MKSLKELVIDVALDSHNAEACFELAHAYQKMGHTASAWSYFHKAAENGSDLLAYESLLRGHYCFEEQKERDLTSKAMLKQAQMVLPRRPESYYLLARYHMNRGDMKEGYVQLKLADQFCDWDCLEKEPLKTDVGFKNKISFYIDLASCAWDWDKYQEARDILRDLMLYHYENADSQDRKFIKDAIDEVGIKGNEEVYCLHNKKDHKSLQFKFKDSDKIETNYSQCYQDMFVLYMNEGKTNGTYFEVGAGPAFEGSNTALLEKNYGWKGVSIENDPHWAREHNTERDNQILFDDALSMNYEQVLNKHFDSNVIDYLQLDIEPTNHTFECLLQVPFDEYKFRVITYEHDHYIDFSKSYRKKSRKYLQMMGYELVIGDVSPEGTCNFEDWWVHPDLVNRDLIEKIKHTEGTVNIKKYMLGL